MGQQHSASPSTPILAIPWELIALIMSFKDQSFEIAVAMTCRTLYERCKRYYTDQMALMLYDPRGNFSLYRSGIKIFHSFISFDWLRREFISVMDVQNGICFSEKFTNLELLGLNNISFGNIESIFPKLPLLKHSHLSHCTMTEDHFSEMLSNCIHLETVHLMNCKHPKILKLPPQLKKFEVFGSKISIELDLSLCEKLKHL
jgi:hypothetical protein